MTSDDFIVEAQQILDRHKAAVVYLHNAEGEMVAALIQADTREWFAMQDGFSDNLPGMPVHSHIEPGVMIRAGWQRLIPWSAPDAVAWWYVYEFEDGFIYARGGRCQTTRDARHLYRDHCRMANEEHQAFLERPIAFLTDAGEINPIDYGPYGVEHR